MNLCIVTGVDMAAYVGTTNSPDLQEQAFSAGIIPPLPKEELEQIHHLLLPLDTNEIKPFISN